MTKQWFLAGLGTLCLAACGGGGNGSGNDVSPPPATGSNIETVDFAFTDFSEVAVGGPFFVTLREGDAHSVELTVDTHIIDLLDVRKTGPTLHIGFQSDVNIQASVLEARITMPSLTKISLAGATYGVFSGFSGNALEVELTGAALLEADDVGYDFVSVRATAACLLLMEKTRPASAAHADLTAASSATFNLMDGATLTGSLTAASAILYYGSGVTVDVDTDLTSAVTRVGNTIPL